MFRGLITWQWAPDCRPARQAGQLLGLTRLGSIFYSPMHRFRVLSSLTTCNARFVRVVVHRMHGESQKKEGRHMAGLRYEFVRFVDQAFFTACDTHQPFALTALPGNSWHGPKPVAPPV